MLAVAMYTYFSNCPNFSLKHWLVMLVNQSKFGKCEQKENTGDNLRRKLWTAACQHFTHFYYFKGLIFHLCVGFNIWLFFFSFFFYMGKDHSLPFMSIQITLFYFIFCCTEIWVGRSESSAIDLELFEQGDSWPQSPSNSHTFTTHLTTFAA